MLLGYGIAVVAVASAIVLRLLLDPILADRNPFITVFLAVVFTAWYSGRGPGLLALALGTLGATYFILPPRQTMVLQPEWQIALVIFVLSGGLVVLLFESIRRKREQAAEESELLSTTLASIGDGIITTDKSSRVTRLNSKAQWLTGWKNQEATGNLLATVYRVMDAANRQVVGNPLLKALQQDSKSGPGQYSLLVARDGTERCIEDGATPILSRSGEVIGYVLIIRDVTDRQCAEKEIAHLAAESEKQRRLFKAVLSNTPDLAFVFDLNHRFTYANDALLALWGRTWEQAIGRNCLELGYEPAHAAMHDRELDEVVKTKKPIRGVVSFTGTSGKRQFDYIFVPVINDNGDVEAVAGTTRDITEQKENEAELRTSEEFNRTVLESSPDCVKVLDAHGCMISMNTNGLCLLEIDDFAHYLGRDWIQLWPQESQPRIRRAVEAAQAGETIRFQEFCPTAKGTNKWWDVITAPILDEQGKVVRLISVSRDVTEQRRTSEDLRNLSAELSAANRRKDEFLATLAHELRNPLAPLRNGLQILRQLESQSTTCEQALAMMERQLGQMVHLVDDLLDVSRISQGKLELRRQPVDLQAVLQHAVETSKPVIEAHGQQLTLAPMPASIQLEADTTRLGQVFANLLNNAAKYSEPGGRIELHTTVEGERVVVSVKDAGIGIPPAMLPKIFEIFTQVDRSLEKSQGGLGLGLTLVKRLVEMHGGTVEARSEGPGQGSEFLVTLPILQSASENTMPMVEKTTPAVPAGSSRILVADDNVDSAESMALLLNLLGHEVRTAHDGLEALTLAKEFLPTVILLDIGMPKLNGYETCRQLREQPWGEEATIIAMTGWGQDEDRRRSQEAGFTHHLVKPVDPAVLQKLLAGK